MYGRFFWMMAALFVLMFFAKVAGVFFLLMAFFKIAGYIRKLGFSLPDMWTVFEWSLMIVLGIFLIGFKISYKH